MTPLLAPCRMLREFLVQPELVVAMIVGLRVSDANTTSTGIYLWCVRRALSAISASAPSSNLSLTSSVGQENDHCIEVSKHFQLVQPDILAPICSSHHVVANLQPVKCKMCMQDPHTGIPCAILMQQTDQNSWQCPMQNPLEDTAPFSAYGATFNPDALVRALSLCSAFSLHILTVHTFFSAISQQSIWMPWCGASYFIFTPPLPSMLHHPVTPVEQRSRSRLGRFLFVVARTTNPFLRFHIDTCYLAPAGSKSHFYPHPQICCAQSLLHPSLPAAQPCQQACIRNLTLSIWLICPVHHSPPPHPLALNSHLQAPLITYLLPDLLPQTNRLPKTLASVGMHLQQCLIPQVCLHLSHISSSNFSVSSCLSPVKPLKFPVPARLWQL